MKVTNISPARIYLSDLRATHSGQTEGRRGEDRYLGPGDSVYLPNTSEVLRSAVGGDLYAFNQAGKVTLEDDVTIASGDTLVLTHGFHFPPAVSVLKFVSGEWVDGTGTVDVFHNVEFTEVAITNTTGSDLRFYIRLL